MSLVTSCPHCSTMFVVRPEQLAVHQAKVRCGSCRQVFNALDSLQQALDDETPASADVAPEQANSTVVADSVDDTISVATPPIHIDTPADTEPTEPELAEYPPVPPLEIDVESAAEPAPETETTAELDTLAPQPWTEHPEEPAHTAPADEDSSSSYLVDGDAAPEDATLEVNQTDHYQQTSAPETPPRLKEVISGLLVPIDLSPVQDDANDHAVDPDIAESYDIAVAEAGTDTVDTPELDTFEQEAAELETAEPATGGMEEIAIPDTPVVATPSALSELVYADKLKPARSSRKPSLSLLFVCLVLLLLAAMQSVYFLRTPIATEWPILKPHLLAACKIIGCALELPKNADLLSVDDPDLHEDSEHPGVIRLRSTLINNARYTQQYPLLELTLTDANQAPVLRRTFKPVEYLPAGSDIKTGLAANDEVQIHLAIATQATVSGYRVYITY